METLQKELRNIFVQLTETIQMLAQNMFLTVKGVWCPPRHQLNQLKMIPALVRKCNARSAGTTVKVDFPLLNSYWGLIFFMAHQAWTT